MDSGAIDSAVITLLQGDATLHGLCPDGVFFSVAPQGARRFVVVSVTSHEDVGGFGEKGFEEFDYLVMAVIFSTSGSDARKAAAQIDALLDGTTALAPTGYTVVDVERTSYRRYTEPDVNPDQRWQHHGGSYLVAAVPSA